MDTVQEDPSDPPFLPVPAMNLTPTRPLDDDLDSPDSPDRILQELSEEHTGEPSPAGDAEEEDLTGLTEAELEGASGIESPPGRID